MEESLTRPKGDGIAEANTNRLTNKIKIITRETTMKLNGTWSFSADQDQVWKFLIDPEQLAKCMPGCEKLEQVGQDEYAGQIKVGLAAVKGVYKGTVKIDEIRPPVHYKLTLDGKGRQGFLKGTGTVDLDDQGDSTVITYSGDVQIGGPLASVGQRMMDGAAKMIVGQFFKAMEGQMSAGAGMSVSRGQGKSLLSRAVNWLYGLLGKGR